VWDAPGGKQLVKFEGHECEVTLLAFSPDGLRLASADCARSGNETDKVTIRIWNLVDRVEAACLRGHKGGIGSMAFSPDGARLVALSQYATVHIWEVARGAELVRLPDHVNRIKEVFFLSDGTTILSILHDGTLHVVDLTTQSWREVTDGKSILAIGSTTIRLQRRELEMVIESGQNKQLVAAFPAAFPGKFWPIVSHPGGRTWAGATGNHLELFTLEGTFPVSATGDSSQ
jgi:WD40 repeat protein